MRDYFVHTFLKGVVMIKMFLSKCDSLDLAQVMHLYLAREGRDQGFSIHYLGEYVSTCGLDAWHLMAVSFIAVTSALTLSDLRV